MSTEMEGTPQEGGEEPRPQEPAPEERIRREGLRGLAWFSLGAVPPAVLGVLWLSDFFDTFGGHAACHRPVPGGDGVGDRELRFVLLQSDGGTTEVILPTAAFKDSDLVQCLSGTPPARLPDNLPLVQKDLFSLQVRVESGDQERTWPTSTPVDLFLPLFLAFGIALPVRNWLVTNSPFRLAGRVDIPPMLQPAPGRPAPPKSRGSIGPPPKGGKKRKRGR